VVRGRVEDHFKHLELTVEAFFVLRLDIVDDAEEDMGKIRELRVF
jgi:hypothetical protein